MSVYRHVKLATLLSSLVLSSGLTACSSGGNPLKKATPEAAAEFLVAASRSAEKTLHVFTAPGGYYYGVCMEGKEKQVLCDKLYRAMVRYANTTTEFKGITVNELTDLDVYQKTKEDYHRVQFNTV